MIGRYGHHYNGMMMSRPFPGIHPLTAYDLTDGWMLRPLLMTPPPSSADGAADVTGLEGLSLCEGLGFKAGSVRGDRGLSMVEFVKGAAGLEGTTTTMYYLGAKANSILRERIKGRGWVENEETGERACVRRGLDYHGAKTDLITLSKMDRKNRTKRRVFLFITNDGSRRDPFDLLDQYRMRGEHERQLGCLSALGIKHLPNTESREEEVAGHLLLFMKLQSILKLFCERFGMKGCEPKTLANLLCRRGGMSWTDGDSGRRKTMILSNRAAIDQEARRRRDQAQLRRLARGGADR